MMEWTKHPGFIGFIVIYTRRGAFDGQLSSAGHRTTFGRHYDRSTKDILTAFANTFPHLATFQVFSTTAETRNPSVNLHDSASSESQWVNPTTTSYPACAAVPFRVPDAEGRDWIPHKGLDDIKEATFSIERCCSATVLISYKATSWTSRKRSLASYVPSLKVLPVHPD